MILLLSVDGNTRKVDGERMSAVRRLQMSRDFYRRQFDAGNPQDERRQVDTEVEVKSTEGCGDEEDVKQKHSAQGNRRLKEKRRAYWVPTASERVTFMLIKYGCLERRIGWRSLLELLSFQRVKSDNTKWMNCERQSMSE